MRGGTWLCIWDRFLFWPWVPGAGARTPGFPVCRKTRNRVRGDNSREYLAPQKEKKRTELESSILKSLLETVVGLTVPVPDKLDQCGARTYRALVF